MDRQEAMELFNKTEIVFKNNDAFSCVSTVYDPLKLFNRDNDTTVTDLSKSFQLEFMHDMTMYALAYTPNKVKLINMEDYDVQNAKTVESFPDIIKTLEKDEDEDGTNE